MSESKASGPVPAPADVLSEYLAWVEDQRHRTGRTTGQDPVARRWGQILVPHGLRQPLRLAATRVMAPAMRRRASRLARHRPLLLNLGSAGLRREGWLSVDLAGDPVDLAWDLTRPLPFADGSVDGIFHEHFITVLTPAQGYALSRECHRLLRPGGALRVVAADPWVEGTRWEEDAERRTITRLLAMQEIIFYPGVRTVYDAETLRLVLGAAGFTTVAERQFGETSLDPVPDSERRRGGSIFVEAVRGG